MCICFMISNLFSLSLLYHDCQMNTTQIFSCLFIINFFSLFFFYISVVVVIVDEVRLFSLNLSLFFACFINFLDCCFFYPVVTITHTRMSHWVTTSPRHFLEAISLISVYFSVRKTPYTRNSLSTSTISSFMLDWKPKS